MGRRGGRPRHSGRMIRGPWASAQPLGMGVTRAGSAAELSRRAQSSPPEARSVQ
ncbi:hypothetical protein ACFPM0_12580 [Pseudonocardia sulfidoxydans]|uniref:hypothetical protein n=1 Tax=Pseudonocardia sulfidoxydans TaxID=54011 RepID=UPI003607FF5B